MIDRLTSDDLSWPQLTCKLTESSDFLQGNWRHYPLIAKWGALTHPIVRGVTGIFFWGGKFIFPDFFPDVKCFFPVENSRFGRPKTNFRRFQKWKTNKQKNKQTKKPKKNKNKKKKKKRSSPLFRIFPTSIYNFPPSLLQFSFFSSQFLPLFHFSLPLFSRYVSKKFPGQKSRGGGALCPLPPLLRTAYSPSYTLYSPY